MPTWLLEWLALPAAQYGRGDWGPGMMMPYWGYGWMGWIMMILFWGVVIVAGVALVRWLLRGGGQTPGGPAGPGGGNRALDILKERYAKGEIDKDQFERMKKDINSA